MNAYKNASYSGYVLYIFGIVLIVFGLYNFGIEMGLDENGIVTSGTVYELQVEEPYRQAWVEFNTTDGRLIRFLDKLFWNQDFAKYKVGQEVEVIYDPADPQGTATINDFFQRNTAPWWPYIVGLVVIFTGWIMRRSMLKQAANYEARLRGDKSAPAPDYEKTKNRAMLIAFISICLIILIFVVVFGVYGEY